jgi:hypothetical protein
MAARLRERPLFEANELCYRASTSAEDRTSASPGYRASAPSNFNGEEGKKDSSPVDPSTSEAVAPEAVTSVEEQVKIDLGRLNGAGVSFAHLVRDYPHLPGSLDQPAYRPSARKIWNTPTAEQQQAAAQAASKAPGTQWLKYWLQDGVEAGVFEVVEQRPVSRVWVREGTPQWKAWQGHYRGNGRTVLKTQRMVGGEQQTGWMFESEWPPVVEQTSSPEGGR